MVNSSTVLTSGAVPELTLLTDNREPPAGGPSTVPGAPITPPADPQPDTKPNVPELPTIPEEEPEPGTQPQDGGDKGKEDNTEPTQPDETEATEEPGAEETGEDGTEGEEEGKKDEKDERQTHAELVEACDHGAYPYVAIGGGILSLVLLVAVILQALRLRSFKKRIAQLSKRKTGTQPQGRTGESVAPIPAVVAPSESIQIGKLHAQGARGSQQDCLAVSPLELYPQKGLLALVADGMGGLSDGDRMSQAAASAMMNGFMGSREGSASDLILSLTMEANQAVNRVLGPQNQGRSGTTLVGGVVKDGLFHYVSVGDSRICLFRQGALTQLNREHVYRNELATQAINGAGTLWDANTHPKAGALTSYLGMGSLKYVDIPAEPVKLRGGDKIILMSDGVYNALSILELENALAKPAQQAADTMGQIIHSKNFRNQDNYTAVILEF